jgi:hypothetical protein
MFHPSALVDVQPDHWSLYISNHQITDILYELLRSQRERRHCRSIWFAYSCRIAWAPTLSIVISILDVIQTLFFSLHKAMQAQESITWDPHPAQHILLCLRIVSVKIDYWNHSYLGSSPVVILMTTLLQVSASSLLEICVDGISQGTVW